MSGSIIHLVGARPNFMKATPVVRAFHHLGMSQRLVHTGQHYSDGLSDVFFRELNLPEPDLNLGVGSGSHAVQTAATMTALESALPSLDPSLLILYGDVNSTLAGALVAAKLRVPAAHVEAGLRSYDRSMPEEVNRVVVETLADRAAVQAILSVSELLSHIISLHPRGRATLEAAGLVDGPRGDHRRLGRLPRIYVAGKWRGTIGERLRRVRHLLKGEEIFLANNGDIVTDAPLDELIERFQAEAATADLRINGGGYLFGHPGPPRVRRRPRRRAVRDPRLGGTHRRISLRQVLDLARHAQGPRDPAAARSPGRRTAGRVAPPAVQRGRRRASAAAPMSTPDSTSQ